MKHEIDNLKILCLKVENDKIQEEDFMKTMFNEHMALSIEYWNKVVDPIYNGNGLKAIHDLMRKAVKEHSG